MRTRLNHRNANDTIEEGGFPAPSQHLGYVTAKMNHKRRHHFLDGLRALSIVPVLLSHGIDEDSVPVLLKPFCDGKMGVTVFFVVSGYLITRLLGEEQAATGGVRLRPFFGRRLAKLLPVLWLYCALVGGWAFTNGLASARDLMAALTLTTGFWDAEWYLGHVWSLTVEEVFYLTWAPVMAFAKPKQATFVALGVLGVALLAALLNRLSLSENVGAGFRWWTPRFLIESFGSVAIGSLVALHGAGLSRLLRPWLALPRIPFALSVLGLIYVFRFPFHLLGWSWPSRLTTTPSLFVVSVAVGVTILAVASWRQQGHRTLLEAKVLTTLGRATYSIYVVQQFFCVQKDELIRFPFQHAPWNLLLAVGVGFAAYRWIEEPARQWIVRRGGWARAGGTSELARVSA